ncbi:hypothetical protein [Paenirhodobacter populi]|uniref:Dihydroorotate dehydrogenase n=1 Tax=Paenirhodobacter populi TaxID=2306993 RepID=A0A443KA88_9RHOB|nr:hypothetical protein [Sinirhodobacter populi]RWR09419.1 hypothetical protein D2T32_06600 [Sinirhodobacter populi]RWR29719.1 hypothetical protein D2T31_09780 [Sinirhodobacter populi]
MTDKRTDDDRMLERFFAAARDAAPVPEPAFLTVLMNEAEAALPARPQRRAAGGRFTGWLALLGGWKAVGGLATAAVAGLWIGFAGVERLLPATDSAAGLIEADAGSSFLADSDILVLAAQ